MTMPRRAALGVAGLAAVVGLAGCWHSDASGFDHAHSAYTAKTISAFSSFPIYWLGTRFEKYELSSIRKPIAGSDVVLLTYGHCKLPTTGDERGCNLPITIWVAPLCWHLDVAASNPIWQRRTIRGAPVGDLNGDPVLFASRVQVKVYTAVPGDPQLGIRALRALRSANAVKPILAATSSIPAAFSSTLSGTSTCTD